MKTVKYITQAGGKLNSGLKLIYMMLVERKILSFLSCMAKRKLLQECHIFPTKCSTKREIA